MLRGSRIASLVWSPVDRQQWQKVWLASAPSVRYDFIISKACGSNVCGQKTFVRLQEQSHVSMLVQLSFAKIWALLCLEHVLLNH
jgi:hypothetical protein